VPSGCPSFKPPISPQVQTLCAMPGKFGQSCTFRCWRDWKLIGKEKIVCQEDGRWSSPFAPICVHTRCPNLVRPANGDYTGSCFGSPIMGVEPRKFCSFKCDENFYLVGSQLLMCRETGQWDFTPPICSSDPPPNCPNITSVMVDSGNVQGTLNGLVTSSCEGAVPGDTCTFICLTNFTLGGSKTITCLKTGQWSDKISTCTGKF